MNEGRGASGLSRTCTARAEAWTLQIEKHRSLTDKLRGANKMSADDPLSLAVERILRADLAVTQFDADKDA